MKTTKISIIIALLNEADNLEPLYHQVIQTLNSIPNMDWELIFVDDGSTDESWKFILNLSQKDQRIRGLQLSKNFGNHAALLAGLRVASGDIAMNLAADLQTPTCLIQRLFQEYLNGADIVFGARKKRSDSYLNQIFSRTFYLMVNALTSQKMPYGGIDIFLISRKVIHELSLLHGRNTSILGLIMNLGFHQKVIEYDRPPRAHGQSKWTLRKKVSLFANGILSFSATPLRLCLPIGFCSTVLGLCILIASSWLGKNISYQILAGIFILAGMQLFSTSLLGEYLYRVFQEASQHPVFIVKNDTCFQKLKNISNTL